MMRTSTVRFAATALALSLLYACSGGEDDGGDGAGLGSGAANGSGASGSGANGSGANGSGASGSGASSAGGNGSGGTLVIGLGGDDGLGAGARPGNGMPETCDGVDNDDNGIIDDVDEGGDGVCDCLNIATIGEIGPWSDGGNIFTEWLDSRSPIGAAALGDQELTAELLQPYQVIVVLHAATLAIDGEGVAAHHEFSADEASAFGAWVKAGGGVMTTIGYTNDEASEVENVNELLAELGMGYSTSKLDLGGDISMWEEHPVTDGVSNIYTDNGVEPLGNGELLAFGQNDALALDVAQVEDGRVVVWGDEWITYDSEWADVEGQQVELFWLNILKWLSPPTECQVPIPPQVK